MNDIAYTGQQDHTNCPAIQLWGDEAIARELRIMKKRQQKKLKLKRKAKKPFGDFFPSRYTKSQWRHNRRGAI
jgi:hypothetical protein